MKKFLSFLLSFLLFISSYSRVAAIVNPLEVPNNKVGIHIFSEKDLEDSAKLVNTNGGDWGYVTFVITESERDHDRWQKVFNDMRKLHLVPIVRLATKASGNSWDAPGDAEINNWASFLDSLNWVTENRYVIINNEPNHANEWGGRLDPEGYAVYLKKISEKLKGTSLDFFILPAGLDPSSVNTSSTMTSKKFIQGMAAAVPDVFEKIDGWTSHSYPHASLSAYEQELTLINKKLPVFITETGWQKDKFSEDQISKNIVEAYKNIWNDPNVVAVTPFILDYTSPPFENYSWRKSDGSYYSYYTAVKDMPKVKGEPVQVESGQILAAFAEPVILSGMDFVGAILARNTGQTIWNKSTVTIGSESPDFMLNGYSLNDIEPTKFGLIFFRAASNQTQGIYLNSLYINGIKKQHITNSFSIEAAFIDLGKDWGNKLLIKVGQLIAGIR
jgi:hypothetical protein